MRLFLKLATLAATALISSATVAQAWPAKPIRIIVPYPPGGTSDILARAIGPKITPRRWGSR